MSSPSKNGRITLSAVDFLALAETKRVARVDLSEVGVDGIVYVCDLSAAQQQRLFGGQNKMRVYKDQSRDIALPQDATAKLMRAAMVTDGQDGSIFEAKFADTDEEYIIVAESELVKYEDLWLAELGKSSAVNDHIQRMPNVVTNLVTRAINNLSGLGEDAVEEKKSS